MKPARAAIPQRIGPEDVHQISQIANVFRAADHAGHPVAGQAMAAQLQYALRLLEAKADRKTKTAMQVAVGRLANVIGWSQFDAGYHWEADQYFRIGLHNAEQAGAWWLRADVLTHMARQAVYLEHADDALTLIGTAKIREDQLSSLRRSALCIVEARAFSELGEAREAARSVDRAVQFFYEVDERDDPDWELYSDFFSEAQLNGDTGHGLWAVAVHGLETANAVQRLAAAIDSYPDRYARSRLFCIARLAALTLHQGDPDEGVALGQQALAAAREVRSMRVLDDLGELHRATTQLRDSHAGVAALRRDIAATLSGRNYKELTNA
jgi:tetratricopeptide (TPR) repeat protein